jgi:uncharacterized protein YqiB (DUF1249 family)
MNVFSPVEKSFWLQKVCEHNYEQLKNLIPDWGRIGENSVACVQGKPSLHLRLLERSVYTLVLELTHDFTGRFETQQEPAVKIRVCLDAKTAEVLSDSCRPFVLDALRHHSSAKQILDYKWSHNYFLTRWLEHCLKNNYQFGTTHVSHEQPGRLGMYSCPTPP